MYIHIYFRNRHQDFPLCLTSVPTVERIPHTWKRGISNGF